MNKTEKLVAIMASGPSAVQSVRSYFSSGNTIPVVLLYKKGELDDDQLEYFMKASDYEGVELLEVDSDATEMDMIRGVAEKFSPDVWAVIFECSEISGCLDECFEYACRSSGFILSSFVDPGTIDNMHPESVARGMIRDRSPIFFHGDANTRILADLNGRDGESLDDVLKRLYYNNVKWHDGFCDFSIRRWVSFEDSDNKMEGREYKVICRSEASAKEWAEKSIIPPAPFEKLENREKDGEGIESAVDAVFVIGTGSFDNNEELRYALRNLERNCKFIRDVYICGFCPKWVDRSSVKHLNWPDRFSHAKDANIIDKLRHACEHEGIAKRILFCSDDQFQTHPCEWDDFYPRYLRVFDKSDSWYEAKRRVWHTRLRKTLMREFDRRMSYGIDTDRIFYYQPHMWMQIDRDKFINYAKWCNYEGRDDTIIASGYFNFIDADGKPDSDHVFLGSGATKLPDATHIAYHDGSYKAAMSLLRKMFPEKSRFEIGYGKIEAKGHHIGEPEQKIRVTGLVGGRAGDFDPSKASKEEIDEILEVSSMIRDNPVWNGLLSEISRAEELRLFGVMGWRLVWRDLISRWRDETKNGSVLVPVSHERSEDASGIVNAYMSDPDSMRTIKFGVAADHHSRSVPSFGRQMPRTPPEPMMSALRNKIRTALRKWHK